MWRVDTENRWLKFKKQIYMKYPYVLKDGVLTFNNDSYVKEGSEIYKKAKKNVWMGLWKTTSKD